MKTGRTLQQLASEIERQQASKQDYVAPVSRLRVDEEANLYLPLGKAENDNTILGINELAHRQLGQHVGIPAQYYDKLRSEAPLLFASNVNHWLAKAPPEESRMVRTLDGRVRALLSDRYRPLENA